MSHPIRALLAGAIVVAALPAPGASGAATPCAAAWPDAPGDTVYNTGTGLAKPAVADDDLDALGTTVRATATDLVVTVRVARLAASGPAVGTGHGVSLVLTSYGRTMVFAARKDATYGDARDAPDAASVVRLDADPATSTFTLTVRRADVARAAGAPSGGGDLSGIYVSTIRHDAVQGAVNATPAGAGRAGLPADDTAPGDKGGGLSLDACDTALRTTSLRVAVSGSAARRVVTATLRDGTGAALAGQRVRVVADGRTLASATTSATGVARCTVTGGRTVTVVYDGVPGAHAPAEARARL